MAPAKFTCDVCSKDFTRKINMANHIANKHAGKSKMIGCSVCGKKFSHDSSRRTHEKKEHRAVRATAARAQPPPLPPPQLDAPNARIADPTALTSHSARATNPLLAVLEYMAHGGNPGGTPPRIYRAARPARLPTPTMRPGV